MAFAQRRIPWTRQPQARAPVVPALAGACKFLAMPGLPRPVFAADQGMTYPAAITAGGIWSSNVRGNSISGQGVAIDASHIGLQFKRANASSDAYIGLAAGADQTWLFVMDVASWTGTNPGFFRAGPSGNQFVLFPSGGLWVRVGGTDFNASRARPSSGPVVVQVSIKSGVWLKAWVNGFLVLNQTITATTSDMTSTNGANFLFKHSATEYPVGNAVLCALFNSAVPYDLTGNPWAIFAPRSSAIWIPAAAGGATYNDTLAAALTLADATAAAASYAATLGEAATLADALVAAGTCVASVAETVILADALSGPVIFAANLSESATLADAYTTGSVYNDTLAAALTLADAAAAAASYAAILGEAATLADALVAAGIYAAAVAEGASLGAAVTTGSVFSEAVAETFAAAAAMGVTQTLAAALGETLAAAVTLGATQVQVAAVAEGLAVSAAFADGSAGAVMVKDPRFVVSNDRRLAVTNTRNFRVGRSRHAH